MKHLTSLNSDKLISLSPGGRLSSLPAGSICSQFGAMIATVVTFESFRPPICLRETLDLLSRSAEFCDATVRQEERQKLRMMSVDPALRFGDRRSDDANFYCPETKVWLVVESALAHGRIEDWGLAQEFSRIRRTAERLLACMFHLMVNRRCLSGAGAALLLRKCISQQLWENDSVRVSQQIKGIGEVYAKKIHANGIESVAALRGLHAYQLERMTGHRVGWGIPIVEEIARIPEYVLDVFRDTEPDQVCVVVRNASQLDPTGFHKAEVLVGIEETDLLIDRFEIRNVVGHFHATYRVQIPQGFAPEDVIVRCIDAEFIGIDAVKTCATEREMPIVQASPAQPKSRVPAVPPTFLQSEEEEVVVWQMKKPVKDGEGAKPFELEPGFWDTLEFDEATSDDSQA
jgi:hypothetical protein